MQEPNATEASERLQAALANDYQPSHHEFVDTLMNQVFSYQISPPLQRILLLVYIQDHRDRLQKQRDSGLLWNADVLFDVSICSAAFCCGTVPHDQDTSLCQELAPPKTRIWRTSRWQELLARRSKPRVRRAHRVHRLPSPRFFAKSLYWPSFLYAWYLAPILQSGCAGHCSCSTDSDFFAYAVGLWLRIPLSFQAHTLLCQGLQAGLCESTSLCAVVRTRVAFFYHHTSALVTVYMNWLALCSSSVRYLQLCMCSSTRRCWHVGLNLTECFEKVLICLFVKLLLVSTSPLCALLKKGATHAHDHGFVFIRRLWQQTILAFTAVQVMWILWCIVSCQELYALFLRFLGLAYCWCPLGTFWPCLFSRSQHHCKYVVRCKYIVSYMGMMNSLVPWNPRQDSVLPCLKKFPLWPLGDRAQATIRFILTRLHMTLAHLVGVRQGSLLGGCRHVPHKLRIFRILGLSLKLVWLREDADSFELPESAPRAYGRARDQLVKLIGPRSWYLPLLRRNRFRSHLCDHWDERGKPPLPWMKLALTQPLLPPTGIKAVQRRRLLVNRTLRTLTTCLQLLLYIPMILMRCFVLTAMLEHPLRYVHILRKWQRQFMTAWSSSPARKTAFFVSQRPMFSIHNRFITDPVDTQVFGDLQRWDLTMLFLSMTLLVYTAQVHFECGGQSHPTSFFWPLATEDCAQL